jgi:hypothetical protein
MSFQSAFTSCFLITNLNNVDFKAFVPTSGREMTDRIRDKTECDRKNTTEDRNKLKSEEVRRNHK